MPSDGRAIYHNSPETCYNNLWQGILDLSLFQESIYTWSCSINLVASLKSSTLRICYSVSWLIGNWFWWFFLRSITFLQFILQFHRYLTLNFDFLIGNIEGSPIIDVKQLQYFDYTIVLGWHVKYSTDINIFCERWKQKKLIIKVIPRWDLTPRSCGSGQIC